jgi:PAS domain S-box-containing protein
MDTKQQSAEESLERKKFIWDLVTLMGVVISALLLVGIVLFSPLSNQIARFVIQGVFSLLILSISVFLLLESKRYREQNKELIEEVTDLNLRFSILADAVSAVSSTLDLQEMVQSILGVMLSLTGANIGAVLLPDEDRRFFRVVAQQGFREEAVAALQIPLDRGNIGKVFSSGQMMVRKDLPEDPRAVETYRDGRSPSTQIIMALRAKGETVGVAVTATVRPHEYTPDELNLLSNLCHELAVAIINVDLYRQSQKTLQWLSDTQEYTEHFIEELISGVMMVDESGRVMYFNREASKITGIEPKEVIGSDYRDMEKRPELRPLYPFRNPLDNCLQDQRVFRRSELATISREGRRVTVSFNAFPLHRSNGEPLGAAMVFMDITAVKEMESRLRQQDHLSILGQMAAKIAHEVKNPLFAVLGLADELKVGESDPERLRLIEMIEQEATLCNQWITGMLSFSKAPPAEAEGRESAGIHLPEGLHRLLVEFTRVNGRENLRVVEDYEEGLPPVKMTPDQMRHIFTNLFENAFHAMPQGGVLTVRARRIEDGRVEVRVEDTGSGIRPEVLPNIFAPFYTTKDDGTGLGLAIVQKIVLDLGGSIDVRSQLDVGTTFVLRLLVN